jgi:hypothetical protein
MAVWVTLAQPTANANIGWKCAFLVFWLDLQLTFGQGSG